MSRKRNSKGQGQSKGRGQRRDQKQGKGEGKGKGPHLVKGQSKIGIRNREKSFAGFASPAVPVVLVCSLALLQGGFYAMPTCAVALVAVVAYAVFAALRKERRSCSWTTLLVLLIAIACLASSLVQGASATMLLETTSWFAVAGLSLWCVQNTQNDKGQALDWLAMAGCVLAGIAIAVFAGSMLSGEPADVGRLTFPFEYANTAGLFYAVIAVLGLSASVRANRIATIFAIVALLLTQSVGAISVFSVAVVALAVHGARCGQWDRRLAVAFPACVVAVIVVFVALFHGRVEQAAQTFIERIIQVLDASSLYAGHVLLGIGPDQWQIIYPSVQSAQYQAAVVHCSYAQIALDGGLLALAAILILLIGGLVALARRGDFISSVCTTMIAVHALFDFDLQFSAIALLAILLIAQPKDATRLPNDPMASFESGARGDGECSISSDVDASRSSPASAPPALGELLLIPMKAQAPLCWLTVTCALAFSCFGIAVDLQVGGVQHAADGGDARRAAEATASLPWLACDPLVGECAVGALYAAGDYNAVLDKTADSTGAIASLDLYRALALRAIGDDAAAQAAFARTLHDHPYDTDLYDAVRGYIVSEGLGDGYAASFNDEAARANELSTSGKAAWLSNQKAVELI